MTPTLVVKNLGIPEISSPLSKNRDENLRMNKLFNSKSPRACADSRRDFRTMDLYVFLCTFYCTCVLISSMVVACINAYASH